MSAGSREFALLAGLAAVLLTASTASASIIVSADSRGLVTKGPAARAPDPVTPSAEVEASGDACDRFGIEGAARTHGDVRSMSWTPGAAKASCDGMRRARADAAKANADGAFATYDAARVAAEGAAPRPPRLPDAPGPVDVDVRDLPSLPTLEAPAAPALDLPHAPQMDSRFAPPPTAPETIHVAAPRPESPPGAGPAFEPALLWLPAADAGGDGSTAGAGLPTQPAPPLYSRMSASALVPRALGGDLASPELARHVAASAFVTLLFWAAVGLYHRLAPAQQLEHPARRAIYDAIARAPGIRLAQIARATGVHAKTARYHAEALVAARLLARDPSGGYRVPGAAPSIPLAQRLVSAVRARPGIHVSDVARALGVSKACAQTHVTDLLLAGALVSRSDAGARRLFAVDGELVAA